MATMFIDNLLRELVVLVEHAVPALVTHLGGASRRLDDIGEQNGREHALKLGRAVIAMAGNKLLNITEFIFRIAGPEYVVAGWVFDVLHPWNRRRELTGEFDWNLKVGLTMQYQRRHLECRQNCGNIDLT